jgi:hypothetical protein
MGPGEVKDGSSRRNRWSFHTGASHFAARSVRSLAPRSAAERGEGWGEGRLSARPPHPIPDVATTEPPSPRKRGEGAITTTARVVTSHHFSRSLSRSRGAVLRPGFAFCFAHPNFGVAERRETFRCLRGTGWACTIGAGQAPSEAPRVPIRGTPASRRSHRGDFGRRGRASPHRHCGRIGHSELPHPGRSARRRGPCLPGRRLRIAAAGRHSSLRIQVCLENTPRMSKDANLYLETHIVVNSVVGT